MRYLRDLADRLGQTFAYPATRHQASAEIRRLKALASGRERNLYDTARRERLQTSRDMAEQFGGDSRHTADDVTGYGSTATWSYPHQHRRRLTRRTNERVELARYRISSGSASSAANASPRSRAPRRHPKRTRTPLLIERGLTSMRELEAIVADYLDQASRWDAIPVEPVCLDHFVAQPS